MPGGKRAWNDGRGPGPRQWVSRKIAALSGEFAAHGLGVITNHRGLCRISLSERLWVNRDRLLRGDRVQGVRTVLLPSEEQQADRHLTQLRQRLVLKRTQTLNQI